MIEILEFKIDNVDYLENVTTPLQVQETLDESLDVLYIELKGINKELPFKPFADVYIKISDGINTKEQYLLIESDSVTKIVSRETFNHNLLLIEETKWLERFFVEKTITQPLVRDYLTGASQVTINVDRVLDNQVKESKLVFVNNIFSPIKVGEVKFARPYYIRKDIEKQTDWAFNWDFLDVIFARLKITSPSGEVTEISDKVAFTPESRTFEYTAKEEGEYTFEFTTTSSIMTGVFKSKFSSLAIKEAKIKNDYTIRDVINILFETAETLRESEEPLFSIADIEEYEESEQYKERVEEILSLKSPEFAFGKMSLYEALKMIGDYAHFLPRLKQRKLYLDLLGGNEFSNSDLEDYYSYTLTQTTNDFCTKLDSQVNNFVNLDNEEEGSVITPFNDGYRTLRAESGQVKLTDQNIIIPTEFGIEKIIKLEIGYLKNDVYVGDITPYVYEDAEYSALSSYSDYYPYARMYALKYVQGERNITELSFERPNPISGSFEGIAIKNIIYRKINRPVNWFTNLFDGEDVFKLQYRLTYIPTTSARVTQSKAYKEDIKKSISIAYNQSASKLSSRAYGENLKGAIAKMGNVEKLKMYIFPTIDLVPKCGQLFDEDYYISTVRTEYYPNFIKCELGLSKDYNNKSAYVETNSQIRFYEVSEKIATDRYIIYEDYCEIGNDSDSDNLSLLTIGGGINIFSNAFISGYKATQVTMVKAEGFDEIGKSIKEVVLPVITLGVGNSMLFVFNYEDSFSAGSKAYYDASEKVQSMVKYVDDYGEIETLSLKYGINTNYVNNYNDAVLMGDSIPGTENVPKMIEVFSTQENKLRIKKGGAEIPHISYQINFVTNKKSLVIGTGLTSKSPFVTNEVMQYEFFILNERINKFESHIKLTNAIKCGKIEVETDNLNYKIKIKDIVANANGKAWAIVQTYNNYNELIIGENIDIKNGDVISMPTFTFKHKLEV